MTQATRTDASAQRVRRSRARPARPTAAAGPRAGLGARPRAPRSDPSISHRLLGPVLVFSRALNPWVLRLAGRRGVPIAVVRHRGRRSGGHYANPVLAVPARDGFVIALPYGSGANWCRNVLAAGVATIRRHGVEHLVDRAQVLGPAEALPLLPAALRAVVRLVRLRQFLRVHLAPSRT
jgi:deazaflavin-dependent oxidoreductase (nitroreductase family)